MGKFSTFILMFIWFGFMLTSCRPPELEGAFVEYKSGRFDAAYEAAKKATELYPSNAEAWYLLGVLYGKKDSISQMINSFENSLKIDNSKIKEIEFEKLDYHAKKFNSGASNFNKYSDFPDKSSKEAIRYMENSIKDFNDSYLCKPTFAAVFYSAQGLSLIGKKDASKKKFNKLVEAYPDSAGSWIGMGRLNFDEKDYKTASENFKKAIQLDSSNVDAYTFLAHSYDYQDMEAEAMQAYKSAVSLNTEDAGNFFNLGRLYYKLGTKEESSKEEKTISLEKAIENLTKSIDLDPEFLSSYQLKGNALLLLGKWQEAQETLVEGVDRFPDDKQMWGDLATAYANLGEKKKGDAALKRFEEL